jgi:HSP20 family protein
MAEAVTKLPVKTEKSTTVAPVRGWHPFDTLRQEVDRLFDAFDGGFWGNRRSLFDFAPMGKTIAAIASPAVDVAEKEKEYEITVELPGIDEKDIEIKLSNGGLVIRGEKKEEKEEKKKDYYVSERHYGSFERYFGVPEGVDADKIAATFTKGVLKVTLPKSAEAQKQEKKIEVKAA